MIPIASFRAHLLKVSIIKCGCPAELILNTIVKSPHVLFFTPHYHFNLITADPDDNKFVDCAIQANAHYIVTNDHHYDVLQHIEFPKVGLIKLMDFLLMIHG